MKRRYKAQGIRPTRSGIEVHFVVEVGTTMRFATVLVPWFMVTAKEVLDAVDKAVARALRAQWSEDHTLPLESWE